MSNYSTTQNNHYDQILTDLVLGERQSKDGFIADKVFPQMPVSKQSDRYYIWERDSFNRDEMKPWAYGSPVQEVEPKFSQDSYFCDVYALGASMKQDEIANADAALRIRQAKMLNLMDNVEINREKKFLDTFYKAGVWTTDWTGVASNPTASQIIYWSDYTNSTPIQDIRRLQTQMYVASGGVGRPNVMVMTQDVYDVLVNHPDILARISGGATTNSPAYVTKMQMAAAFEVEEILVTTAMENIAAEGLTEDLGFMESGKVGLFYRQSGGGWMVPSAGFIFTWTAESMNSGFGMEVHTLQTPELAFQGIAEKLQIRMCYDMKVTSPNMGAMITGVLE